MNKTVSFIYERPHYYDGQLLREGDFLAEQNYHAGARRRHNLKLHGWGVVRGFEVTRKTDNSITVNAGYAIEDSGQEVFLEQSKGVDLSGFGPNDVIRISLKYEEDPAAKQKRRECRAVISVARVSEDSSGLSLATVTLDGEAKIDEHAIDNDQKTYVRILKPESIRPPDLHPSLKTGWLRLPFRPMPAVEWQMAVGQMVEGQMVEWTGTPPFRVYDTTAWSRDPKERGEQDRGAEGTMEIAVPPGATKVIRLRIAGAENKDKIILQLHKGGWDQKKMKHYKETIIEEEITGEPYLNTFGVKGKESEIDSKFHTLSLELKGTKRTSVSLIAVKFVYYSE